MQAKLGACVLPAARRNMNMEGPVMCLRLLIIIWYSTLVAAITATSGSSDDLSATRDRHEVYIVYLGSLYSNHGSSSESRLQPEKVTARHYDLLASVKGSHEESVDALLYSYKHSFHGFSALLTHSEASALSNKPGVISVFPSQHRKMHTTRSWQFLGMDMTSSSLSHDNNTRNAPLRARAKNGVDTIIGVLDSGVWPESESFKDDGMPPVPPTWQGECEVGEAFNASHCNRKLIGARTYIRAYEQRYGPLDVKATGEYRSVRDKDGHGTHTASTAAGREVMGAAALGGYGAGRASGGATLARLAIYKVCWPIPGGDPSGENTCSDADMLAAFDDALADGVHVISISIGSPDPQPPFFEDAIAIGSLHAVRRGVPVAASGGNDGPTPATVANTAPWIITVAASSVDRLFHAPVTLGNGKTLEGQTVTPYSLQPRFYPLIDAKDGLVDNAKFNRSIGPSTSSQCLEGSLDPKKVRGKIVFCLRGVSARVAKGLEVKRAGGAGMILGNLPSHGSEIAVDAHLVPATAVTSDITQQIQHYLSTSRNPTAKLIPAKTNLGVKPSPFIAAFSSQGPNSLTAEILKPDISAPGLNILAAWTPDNGPSKLATDKRKVKYNIYSGTSMACPHVSGTAALIRAIHPSWSAAMIKSALMTTASTRNSDGVAIKTAGEEEASPFAMGAGEMRPDVAAEPGLVYDASFEDYLGFLCAIGYNKSVIAGMADDLYGISVYNSVCSTSSGTARARARDLNLPSVTIQFDSKRQRRQAAVTVVRRVTNVASSGSTYRLASLEAPKGSFVLIRPSRLVFSRPGQTHSFKIKVSLTTSMSKTTTPTPTPILHKAATTPRYAFGSFTWMDDLGHQVRSPIVLRI